MIDPDFIKRCEEFAKPMVIDFLERRRERINKWNKDNPEKLKECRQVYERTGKGIEARKKVSMNRHFRFKKACENLTESERDEIREFYRNCPEGYEVDHIVPIAKGGKHHVSNLQYLTWKENSQKAVNIFSVIRK